MLKSNSKRVLIGQLLAGVFSLVGVSFSAKYVGPLIFGFCSIFVLIMNFAVTFLDYGACSWAARELASDSMSTKTYNTIKRTKTKLFLLVLVLAPGYLILAPSDYRYAVLLLLYPALSNRSNFNQQYLLVKGLVSKSVFLIVVDRLCWLLIIPCSFIDLDKVFAFTLPIIVGLVAQSILFHLVIKHHSPDLEPAIFIPNRDIFTKSKYFGRIGASGTLSNFDGVLLSAITSLQDSSSYLLAQRFRNPFTIVFTSIAMRLRPIASSRNRLRIIYALRADSKLVASGSIINLLIAIVFLFYSDKFFGQDFKSVNIVLFFGTLSSFPLGVYFLAVALLSALGKEKYTARVSLSYSFCTLFGVLGGSIFYGVVGAVFSVLIIISVHAILLVLKLYVELRDLI